MIQLCAYAEQLARLQGRLPDKIHLILGGVGRPRESFRLADFISYYRWLKADFLTATGTAAVPASNPPVPRQEVIRTGRFSSVGMTGQPGCPR